MPVRVSRLDQPPHRCGFTLRADDPEGYFLGEVLSGWDQKAAISVSYARSLARELGYVHQDEHEELLASHMHALKLLEEAGVELDALKARFAAIDLLESEGFTARKKPGRPVKAAA